MSEFNVITTPPIVLDPREQRGLEIAAKYQIKKKDGVWFVPAQSLPG